MAVRATRLAAGLPEIALDASIGVAGFGLPDSPAAHELLADADAAKCAARRRGGDRRG